MFFVWNVGICHILTHIYIYYWKKKKEKKIFNQLDTRVKNTVRVPPLAFLAEALTRTLYGQLKLQSPGVPVVPLLFQQWVAELRSVGFMLFQQSLPVLLWGLDKMLLKVLYLQQQAVDLKEVSSGHKKAEMHLGFL